MLKIDATVTSLVGNYSPTKKYDKLDQMVFILNNKLYVPETTNELLSEYIVHRNTDETISVDVYITEIVSEMIQLQNGQQQNRYKTRKLSKTYLLSGDGLIGVTDIEPSPWMDQIRSNLHFEKLPTNPLAHHLIEGDAQYTGEHLWVCKSGRLFVRFQEQTWWLPVACNIWTLEEMYSPLPEVIQLECEEFKLMKQLMR